MTAIPRPASTVVLMNHQCKVYLTKRPESMKFLGGFYVFPGGAVEQEDHELDGDFLLHANKDLAVHHAHYIAAARELFEEVGVLLANKNNMNQSAYLSSNTILEYRRQLIEGEISFLQLLRKEKLQFNLHDLKHFGNRTTPSGRPIRFNTHFFLAQLPEGQEPNPDTNEIDEAFWMTPEDAILSFQEGQLQIARPTLLSLQTIVNYQKGLPLLMPELP